MYHQELVWYGHYVRPDEDTHIVFDLGLGETIGTYVLGQFCSMKHPWFGWPPDMVRRWRYARHAEWLDQQKH
jgi:hypothetical protein